MDAKLAQEYLHALKHQRRLAPATLANYARAIELASSQAERLGYERKLRLLAN